MILNIGKRLFLLLLFGILPSYCTAWLISPTMETVSPEKPQTFFTILADKGEASSAIEIYACDREIDENGKESEVRNSQDFFIYPSHIILKPYQKRMVRVIWKGNKNINEEKAYRIVAESIPIDFMKGEDKENDLKFQIKMGTQCLCSFYVTPKGVSEKIVCEQANIEKDEGRHFVTIILKNRGKKHGLLREYGIQIQAADLTFKYSKEEFTKFLNNAVNILPNHIRKVRIEMPMHVQESVVSVKLIKE